jgi:hypothetical protein
MPAKRCPFITNGLECGLDIVEEASNAGLVSLRLFRCPLGHRSYDLVSDIQNPVSFGVVEFRKNPDDEMWHFWPTCSQWPTEDFISSEETSAAYTICNECIAKSQYD